MSVCGEDLPACSTSSITNTYSLKSKHGSDYSKSHYSLRVKTIIILAYTIANSTHSRKVRFPNTTTTTTTTINLFVPLLFTDFLCRKLSRKKLLVKAQAAQNNPKSYSKTGIYARHCLTQQISTSREVDVAR